jgi:hypothetical protein
MVKGEFKYEAAVILVSGVAVLVVALLGIFGRI